MLVADVLGSAEVGSRAFVRELARVLLLLDQKRNQVIHEGSDAVAARTDRKVEHHVEGADSAGARQ